MSRNREGATIDYLLENELRAEILRRLLRRTEGPVTSMSANEFAEETGEGLPCTHYHLMVLLGANAVRVVDQAPGAINGPRRFVLDTETMPALSEAIAVYGAE